MYKIIKVYSSMKLCMYDRVGMESCRTQSQVAPWHGKTSRWSKKPCCCPDGDFDGHVSCLIHVFHCRKAAANPGKPFTPSSVGSQKQELFPARASIAMQLQTLRFKAITQPRLKQEFGPAHRWGLQVAVETSHEDSRGSHLLQKPCWRL